MAKNNSLKVEKYARALLRSRISDANRTLDGILNSLRDRNVSCAIFNDHNDVRVGAEYSYFTNYNPYKMSLRSLNELFFSNPEIIKNNDILAQAYIIFYTKNKEALEARNRIQLFNRKESFPPKIMNILNDINTQLVKERTDMDKLFYSGEKDMYQLYKMKCQHTKIDDDEYEKILDKYDFNADELNQTKLAIGLLNTSSKSFANYLDIYSLYHYCQYKELINELYKTRIKKSLFPHDLETKCNILKGAVEEAFNTYCLQGPCEENGYFDSSRLRLAEEKLGSEKAKRMMSEFNEFEDLKKAEIYDKITEIALINPPSPIKHGKTMDEIQAELADLLDGAVLVEDSSKKRWNQKRNVTPTEPEKPKQNITQLSLINDDDIM